MTADYEEVLAPNLYYDRYFKMNAVKILPAEYYVSARELMMVTVLGSCVSACLRDRVSGIGGLNHFMLPENKFNEDMDHGQSMRYGVYAMEVLINQLLKLGAKRNNLEAKVFGGGNVLPGFKNNPIGERNSHFIIDFFDNEGIPLVAKDLLGNQPRKIYFFIKSGKVLVKRLRSLHNDTLIEREVAYRQRLRQSHIDGGVELFS